MSDSPHTLVPFERVGPFRFGASPAECAAEAGAPDRSWDDDILELHLEQRGLLPRRRRTQESQAAARARKTLGLPGRGRSRRGLRSRIGRGLCAITDGRIGRCRSRDVTFTRRHACSVSRRRLDIGCS